MLNILYICTHNRCRSILSEAITNAAGQGKLFAKSAGSQPAGEVHPLTCKYLAEAGYPTKDLASKGWEDDSIKGFTPDVVITVCDNAQGETCPIWLGDTPKLHWGLADPSKDAQDDTVSAVRFQQTIQQIESRVVQLLQIAQLPKADREMALRQLAD